MAINQSDAAQERPLANLGISESEEQVYRWLLTHRDASVLDTARALTLTPSKVQHLLASIEAKGLATHSPEHPRRYIPASPDVALEAIFLQRQKSLLSTQRAIHELQEQASTAQRRSGRQQLVELITSPEAERQVLEQMERSVRREFLALMRPPIRVSNVAAPAEQEHPFQREAQERGVQYRSIVSTELMDSPDSLEGVRSDMGAGEDIRVMADLPIKMVMTDSRLALIPLDLEELEGPALLVRSPGLLNALHELFELFWKRAAPVSFPRGREPQLSRPEMQLSEETKGLVTLLASGLNDKTIASELNISKRTFERRIVELMRILNVRTRFQLGWLAALRLRENEFAAPAGDSGSLEKKPSDR